MPEIKQGRQLTEIYNPSLRKRLKLEVDWQFLHTTAYNFALLMESIHKAGYVIGDVKPENILVNPQALPSIIDTDSFQVRDPEGHIYRCPVGSEGFTPPELIGKNFKEVDQTEVHDRFRLGVIAFTLLFGYEPFKGVWKGGGEPPELNEWVRHNYWPYSGNGKVGLADYMMPLDIVHPELQNLFLRCFNDGYSVPAMRPSAREWRLTLGMAIAELQVCSVVETHLYHRGNSSCCWCERVAKGLPDIFLFNRTVPKVIPEPKLQTPTFVRWMSTSQIVADYPQHRTGQSINIIGTRVPNGSTNFNATKINEFSADKSSVITGESFNLRWNTQNARSVMIIAPGRIFDGRTFPNVGSVQVNASSSPGRDTYILVAKGCDSYGNNMDVQQQIEIDVKSNPIAIASDSGNKTLTTASNHTNKATSKNNQVPVKEDKLVFLFDIAVKGTLIFSLGIGAYGLISFLYSQFNAITSSNSSAIIKSENDHNHQENAKDKFQYYQRAIADYDQAISLNPNDASAYYNRGNAKYRLKDYQGAIADLSQAIQIDPNDFFSYRTRGDAKYALQDYQGAIADYERAIRINPDEAYTYHNRGWAKYELQDYQGAIADFNQAIQIASNNVSFYIARGLAKYKLQDYQGVIADCTLVLQSDKTDYNVEYYGDAYYNRGLAKYELRDYQGAIADYNQAIKINPNDANAYYNRGLAKYELRDYQGAIADYNQAIRINPNDADAYINRGNAKRNLNDLQGAIADYNQAIKINPNDANAYINRGIAKIDSNDRSGGCTDLSRAIDLDSQLASRIYQEYCR